MNSATFLVIYYCGTNRCEISCHDARTAAKLAREYGGKVEKAKKLLQGALEREIAKEKAWEETKALTFKCT